MSVIEGGGVRWCQLRAPALAPAGADSTVVTSVTASSRPVTATSDRRGRPVGRTVGGRLDGSCTGDLPQFDGQRTARRPSRSIYPLLVLNGSRVRIGSGIRT